MILILDFDRTIFDTSTFEEVFSDAVESYSPTWKDGELAKYIYNDTIPFLKKHTSHTLILMTYGNKIFQEAKVLGSSIAPYFNNLVFTGDEHKGDTIKRMFYNEKQTELVVFVDDTLYQLESVLLECPEAMSVRMMRYGELRSNESSCKGCLEVSNMNELEELLKTLI